MPPKLQNIERLTNKARRSRVRRMNESEEEHKQRIESVRLQQSQSRSNETSEQHEARIAQNCRKIALTRSNLSNAGQNLKLKNNSIQMQLILSNQIEKLEPNAFQSNPEIDYSLYPAVTVESNNKVRTHCKAFKFKDEQFGMCSLNDKVKLPVSNPPPEPLITGEDE